MSRSLFPIAGALVLAGCQSITSVDGFDAVAAQSEVVRIDGVGWGRSGDFSIPSLGTVATFRRGAGTTTVNGERLAEGNLAFTLAGGEFDGFRAECAFSRETFEITDELSRRTSVSTSFLTGPYLMTCGYFRGAEFVGRMAMHEEVANDVRTLRSGRAEIGPARMVLRSVHGIPGTPIDAGEPLGYAMDFRSGTRSMAFVNGADRRVALPREGGDERAAALMSSIALALVWDPGDGG